MHDASDHAQEEAGVRSETGFIDGDAQFPAIRSLEKKLIMLRLPQRLFSRGFVDTALITNEKGRS